MVNVRGFDFLVQMVRLVGEKKSVVSICWCSCLNCNLDIEPGGCIKMIALSLTVNCRCPVSRQTVLFAGPLEWKSILVAMKNKTSKHPTGKRYKIIVYFCVVRNFEKEDQNSRILSCLVQLKIVLFNLLRIFDEKQK